MITRWGITGWISSGGYHYCDQCAGFSPFPWQGYGYIHVGLFLCDVTAASFFLFRLFLSYLWFTTTGPLAPLLSNRAQVFTLAAPSCPPSIERVSTRVVVAQPDCMSTYACAHASSVTEPKSHRSLPKHLPLHTEESLEKVHPVRDLLLYLWSSDKLYNSVFSGITGQVVVMLEKLTTKTHSAAAGYFNQLHHYGPPFWFRMNSIGLHRKAKTAIKSTKATLIVQELCESRGGRPGLSVLTSLLVSVDVKLYWTMLRHWSQLVP